MLNQVTSTTKFMVKSFFFNSTNIFQKISMIYTKLKWRIKKFSWHSINLHILCMKKCHIEKEKVCHLHYMVWR